MPKKKMQESQAEQSARFLETVRELEAAGELNPTAAGKRFERMMGNLALKESDMPTGQIASPPKILGAKKKPAEKKTGSPATKIDRSRTKVDRSRTKLQKRSTKPKSR